MKLSRDLEKSFKFKERDIYHTNGFPTDGMIGVDFELVFYGTCNVYCHKFMLAARSKVFCDMFIADPMMTSFKFEVISLGVDKAVANNVLT